MRAHGARLLAIAMLTACPSSAPPPSSGTGGAPPPEPPAPPMVGNVCSHVTAPEGADDSAGVTECPQTTVEALRGIPGQHQIRDRLYRSAIFLGVHNISGMELEAEFEVHANTQGEDHSIELPLPPSKRRYPIPIRQGKKIEVDLQLGYELNVLREGEPAEIHLWGRVLSPFQTPMAEIYSVVVSARLDPDGWIYYFDYPEP